MDARQQRPRLGLFFAIALGFTLILQAPPFLAQRGIIAGPFERFMPIAGLGAFGPLIAALIASRVERGAFVRQRGTFHPVWYAIALVVFPVIYLAGVAAYAVVAGRPTRVLYPPESSQHIAAMILMPLVEEPGWRGFALPRLQARYDKLTASLILGAVWALWHTFMFLVAGIAPTPGMFVLLCANIVFGSVVMSWLFNRTGQSLLVAIVAHVGVHLNNPTHALPENVAPFAVYTAAIAVFAFATLVLDRRAWSSVRPLTAAESLPAPR